MKETLAVLMLRADLQKTAKQAIKGTAIRVLSFWCQVGMTVFRRSLRGDHITRW